MFCLTFIERIASSVELLKDVSTCLKMANIHRHGSKAVQLCPVKKLCPWGSPDIPYNPNGVPTSQMPPIHQLPAVWNVICAYRDILSLHFSRKGPKRAILP